jgi:glycerol-3-phosphate dehydrogenase
MTDRYDVVVVGGGIHGVGVAQAAVAAGHSVLLLEKSRLAAGTSSKSSKLIHGGLRYLESYEFSLVHESLDERALLLRIAPDLVTLKPFFIPIFESTRRGPLLVRAGLSLYAILGRLRRQVRFRRVPRAAWSELDGLITDGLRAVYQYFDAQTDDTALTEAVMKSAIELGAELAMPAEFTSGALTSDGCFVRFIEEGRERSCQARVLVNAAGPWANRVLERIEPQPPQQEIELIQGSHIVVRGQVERGIYYVECPRDGRAIFVMPWKGETMVGTTETRFRGDPDRVQPLRAERSYLIRTLNRYFPRFEAQREGAVLDAFAGLRVLPSGPGHAFHRTREVILLSDRDGRRQPPRVLSIYGGKLTGYRATAAKVIRRIAPGLPARTPVADTKKLKLTAP